MDEPDFLSINEFAKMVRMHPNTVRKSIKKGRLNSFRIGSGDNAEYRIPKAELNRLSFMDLERIIEKKIEEKKKEITS